MTDKAMEAQLEQKAADLHYSVHWVAEVFRKKPPYPGYKTVCTIYEISDFECMAVVGFDSIADAWKWLDKPQSERDRIISEKRFETEEFELAQKLEELGLLPIPGAKG